jgi:hypothetical protein
MHQTAREFFLLIEQEKRHSRFAFNCEETHRAITIASVRYLMLCFTNPEPTIRHTISDTKTWGSEDFQKYARYMDQWPWINYTLHNLKTHRDLCDQKGTVSRLIHTLIKQLSENRWCEFLGNWMACHFGSTKSARDFVWGMASLKLLQSILSRTSDDFKYKILDAAAALKLFRVVDSLLPPCAQVYSQVRRETPLILCARKGLVDAFRVLADQNEDLNAEDITGRTALHHASKNGHEAIVRQLLNRGADKMVKDRRGLRALQLAFKTL